MKERKGTIMGRRWIVDAGGIGGDPSETLFEKGNEAACESLKRRLGKALILCDAKAQCD